MYIQLHLFILHTDEPDTGRNRVVSAVHKNVKSALYTKPPSNFWREMLRRERKLRRREERGAGSSKSAATMQKLLYQVLM